MAINRVKFQKRQTPQKKLTQEERLLKKLYFSLGGIVAIILILVITLNFFGPTVGSLFLIFSKNRNDSGPMDTIPPQAPIFSQVPESTNQTKITLNGITEPGATVTLFVNGPQKAQTLTDSSGTFTFVDVDLSSSTNTIFAKATDENNNESDSSRVFTISYDDKEPELKILSPAHGETIRNLDRRILIRGETNETADIKINDRQAVVRPDNTFELLLGVEEGEVQITIEAVDKAGNSKKESISVTYERTT